MDTVQFEVDRRHGGAGGSWREVEVEVELGADGTQTCSTGWRSGCSRPGSGARTRGRSWLGQRLPAPAPTPGVGRTSTADQVVLAHVREQAEAIRLGDPAVRRDAPGAVYQIRVATRRMRS